MSVPLSDQVLQSLVRSHGSLLGDAVAMDYETFFSKYGAACRTKHLDLQTPSLKGGLHRLRHGPSDPLRNRRPFYLPQSSSIPNKFIRLDPWEMEYLFVVASYAKLGILETGRFNGGSAFTMACANPNVPIYSIDIAPQNDEKLRQVLKSEGVGQNVNLIVGDSQNSRYPEIKDFDILFVDGDHSYEGCSADLENWYPLLAAGGHILLHDCYHGCPVQPAVIDFMDRHDVEVVVGPYKGAMHWLNQTGSIAHLRKRK